jgi:hypothetical protein
MPIVQLEHGISDFATWKGAFDADPIDRAGSGVTHHRVTRPVDDPNYVVVDLAFGTMAEAEAFRTKLRGLWQNSAAAPALRGTPQVRILETDDLADY